MDNQSTKMKQEYLPAIKGKSSSSINTMDVIEKQEILNKSIHESQKIFSRNPITKSMNAKTKTHR